MSTENSQSIKYIAKRARMARDYFDVDQSEMAEKLGIAVGTLSRYENGRRAIPTSVAQKLARLLKISISWLLTGEGPMLENAGEMTLPGLKMRGSATSTPPEPSNVSPVPSNRIQPNMVPLISWVQAGDWQFAADPFHPGDADEWLDTTATRSENAFALSIHGDSMEPEFTDGDIIIVDPEREPVSGSYIVAKNGAEATFKQFVVDGQSVFLKPLNSRYPIRDMTGIEFRIVGVVVEKRKRY
jgi:SOS-response transcriptional repressor LexA